MQGFGGNVAVPKAGRRTARPTRNCGAMIAGRRSESSQHRRARFTTARRSAMPSRHYAGTAQAAARPAAFLRIGGGEAGLFGLFGQAFAKAEARPNAACRCAVCAGRKASGALARAPKPERTGRPAAGGTVCARAGPKAAVPPAPGGQMRKRKGQEQPPVLFCAYTPIRAGLPRPTYSVSARDGHQRPER